MGCLAETLFAGDNHKPRKNNTAMHTESIDLLLSGAKWL